MLNLTFILLAVLLLLLSSHFAFHLYKSLTSPLRAIPGPFWSRFTKLWYLNRVRKGHFEKENIHLHEKYGSIVRLAPDMYSISDISAVKTVYGTGSRFPKSDWYLGWKHPSPDSWTLFSDRNVRRHAETRKRFSSLYSMSSLVNYEEFVDHCADLFAARLTGFSETRETFDLHHWFQCYAFDVIGEMTFGERFGFLDKGEDIQGTIAAIEKSTIYSTLVGIYSKWHPLLYNLLSRFSWSGAGGRAYIIRFVQEKIKKHREQKKSTSNNDDNVDPEAARKTQDFLQKMTVAQEKSPEKITDYHLFILGLSNVNAGSDTTAISLSSIMYYLLKYPDVLHKLRQEIDNFTSRGLCSDKVTFKESQQMPYFQAVVKEALRMHSATGLPLWRVVPDGGAQINGHFFPSGTIVGINTWVAHYNELVFTGANEFRPERWIEESDSAKLRVMNDMYMPFGLGSRTCIGKHISILEMSKLVPRLVRDFDFSAANATSTTTPTWRTCNFLFVKQSDFEVRVRRRG